LRKGVRWDVFTFGTDSSLTTGPGWDNVTGVGTPKGLEFINAVVAAASSADGAVAHQAEVAVLTSILKMKEGSPELGPFLFFAFAHWIPCDD
jgi:hypothetical protein